MIRWRHRERTSGARGAGRRPARRILSRIDARSVAVDYEAIAAKGGILGHGGIVVFDDTVDLAQQARYAMEFCAIESCGKCTPCRIGSTRGVEVIDRIIANREPGSRKRRIVA